MKKVYCNDCKYYILTRDAWGIKDWPECKLLKEREATFEKVKTVFRGFPNVKNEKNDCPNYRRKWWKFWAKK